MKTHNFLLYLDKPFSLKMTVESHGWYQLAPWEWDGLCLGRTARVEGAEELIRVQQPSANRLTIEASSPSETPVKELVSRWLHLDWDPSKFLALCDVSDPAIGHFIRSGGGRFLRGDTFYEDLIKTVCTINTTWRQTKTMVTSIVGLGNGVFPTPLEIQDIGSERLAKECKLGFRAKTVGTITAQLLQDGAVDVEGSAHGSLVNYDYLISLKGIGPYSAAHAMMLMRDFSSLPVDSEVSAYLRECGLDPKDAQNAFKHWGEHRFLGYKLKRIIDQKNWVGD
jgi:3-methyladenine DNA glycosylase/8-oxoguanine DNA glycosylase